MKLIVVTQTVDENDSVLGFFVRWIAEFAKNCEQVHVLALNVGKHNLPENVTVHCLGKTEGKSKLVWLWRLWSLSFTLRREYDATFVHMNPIHVVYVGLLWRLLGKRIGLWYTHPTADLKLKIATRITHVVFTGSDSSFNIKTNKKNVMGQGVDPAFFTYKPQLNTTSPTLIVVGRLSPIKHIENAIDALALLRPDIDARLLIVGGPMSEQDQIYVDGLKKSVAEKDLTDYVEWTGALPADQMQPQLQRADVFIHTSLTHSADKTLPEALASGLFTVSSNRAYQADLPALYFTEPSGEAYANNIREFLALNTDEQEKLRLDMRTYVEEKHSLASLINRILGLY